MNLGVKTILEKNWTLGTHGTPGTLGTQATFWTALDFILWDHLGITGKYKKGDI